MEDPPSTPSYESDQCDFYDSAFSLAQSASSGYSFPPNANPSFTFDQFSFDQEIRAPPASAPAPTHSFPANTQELFGHNPHPHPHHPNYTTNPHTNVMDPVHPQPRLSIDTSFLNNWLSQQHHSLSPPSTNTNTTTNGNNSTPSTPQSYSSVQSPCCSNVVSTPTTGANTPHDAFETFANLDQFDLTPFQLSDPATFGPPQPVLSPQSHPQLHYPAPSPILDSLPFDFALPKQDHRDRFSPASLKPSLANLDMEFSAFMASLPSSSSSSSLSSFNDVESSDVYM
jgi:hypothetical protein